jgi:N-acetylglucosamine-6-phosphate deacetylase
MLQWADMPLHEVVGMLTLNPARAAGVAERKGLLQTGYDADLALWNRDLQLQATICRGHLAWATPAWQTRLQTVQ